MPLQPKQGHCSLGLAKRSLMKLVFSLRLQASELSFDSIANDNIKHLNSSFFPAIVRAQRLKICLMCAMHMFITVNCHMEPPWYLCRTNFHAIC